MDSNVPKFRVHPPLIDAREQMKIPTLIRDLTNPAGSVNAFRKSDKEYAHP